LKGHTLSDTFLAPPTADSAELHATFEPIFARVAAGSAERENGRVLPHEQVRLVTDAGFGRVRIPVERGGFGASLQQTFELLADLGAADPNVAHVFRNHLAFVEDRLGAEATVANEAWIERFLAGEFVGGGWTEAGNGTLDDLKTFVTEEDGGWEVTGAKFYATGSLYADWLDVLGQGPDGAPLTALVRVDQPGVTVIDDWTGFGQRATGSGSANYERAKADRDNVIPLGERSPYLAHFYQEAMLSALAGIVAATQRDGIAALKQRKRAYQHAVTQTLTEDPQLLQVIGRLSALGFGARAALSASAATLDRVAEARLAGADETALKRELTDSNVAIAQAQVVIIDHALEASTIVFDALGASGVSERLRLDRHWRNARTLASHNPRVYKERLLGDWVVNGNDPLDAYGVGSVAAAPAGSASLYASQS